MSVKEREPATVTTKVTTTTFKETSIVYEPKPTHLEIPSVPYTLSDVKHASKSFSAVLELANSSDSPPAFTQDISPLSLTVSYETPYRVRVCISDREERRWRVPSDVVQVDGPREQIKEFRYKFKYNVHEGEIFAGFAVTRQKPTEEVLVKKTTVLESGSSSGKALFDCINEKFVFKDQYLEITTKLGKNSNIYGLGEIVGPLKKKAGDRLTFWARDAPNPVGENNYGSHPFYIELRDGLAHGVFLLNSNGMDIIYGEDKLTYKVIGGILDFYIFLGPSPVDVIEQYAELIGRPCLHPYWSLGYHQCRWGYANVSKVKEMVSSHAAASIPLDAAWIDLDYMDAYKSFTYCPSHYPYRDLAAFIKSLHESNRKMVVIVDPGIKIQKGFKPYDDGIEKRLFIKYKDGDFVGRVWPGTTVFPDWFNPGTQDYWTQCLKEWMDKTGLDGLWLDMNEIANFIDGDITDERNAHMREDAIFLPTAHNPNPNETASDIQEPVVASTQHMIVETVEVETVAESKESSVFSKIKSVFAGISEDIREISRDSDSSRRLCRRSEVEFSMTNPPYAINNGGRELSLSYRTSPMDAYHHNGEFEYDAHNLFGHMEGQTTYRSLRKIRPNKRPFLLSRSTFPSSGRYVAHWLGDNASTWEDLQYSIPGILSFQLFCIPLTGADLCGFNNKCNEELAMRWVELGSFYPFCRNHNVIGMPSQEVYSWESVEKVARKYIGLRYALLPYWYTAFYRSSTKGTPVLRPLWASYPEDKETYNIENQFLIHDGILISPVLEAEKKEVLAYFPKGTWYDIISLEKYISTEKGIWQKVSAPLDTIPVHIRGGATIPMNLKYGATTTDTRLSGLMLVVVLDDEFESYGELYLDDGETPSEDISRTYSFITFKTKNNKLIGNGMFGYYAKEAVLREITVIGLHKFDGEAFVKLEGKDREKMRNDYVKWDAEKKVLRLEGLDVVLTGVFSVSWQ